MRQFWLTIVVVGFLVATWCGAPAWAGPAEQSVRSALDEQSRWLGASAAGWNDYLQTAELHDQLARGSTANRKAVSQILARYQSGAAGLERSRFQTTRRALESWLATLPQFSVEELPQAAQDAKANYIAPRPEQLAAAKARLQQSLARLERYLAGGGRDRQAGWQSYLQWEALQAELAKPETADLGTLQAVQDNFFRNQVGLDLPPFLEARQALRDYANLVAATSAKDPQAAYEMRLDQLARTLEQFAQEPKDADAVLIGETLGYLANTQQAQPLVTAVRRQYLHPNLHASISQRLASTGVNRAVNDVGPVRELILGTDVHGTAHTVGNVSLRTVPSAQRAVLELVMTGYANSNNIGYNRNVEICSKGFTTLSASKRLFFDAHGLQVQPTVAVANTNTTITGVNAHLKLVERIAERRVAEQEREAEAIASRRAEVRLQRRMDNQAAADLARANQDFYNRFRRPLVRLDAFPQVLDFATTADSVRVTALQAGPARLGAPTPPPALTERHDLSVRLHESMIGNAGEAGLGGRTLTDERLVELLQEADREVPEELQITEDKDPWSITFAAVRPISVVFDDQTATISIRGSQFTRGDREINKDMVISAKYRLEQHGSGSRLTREGDVVAEYVSQERQGVADVTFKTFIRRKFAALFKEEFQGEGLELPGRWKSAGKLALQTMNADAGWITLGWDMPAPQTQAVSIGAE